jgi:hypothetical protein
MDFSLMASWVDTVDVTERYAVPEWGSGSHISSMEQYGSLYRQSVGGLQQRDGQERAAFDAFWSNEAQRYTWHTPFSEVCEWNWLPSAGPVATRWFSPATTNLCYNCLDRPIAAGHALTIAYLWYVLLVLLALRLRVSRPLFACTCKSSCFSLSSWWQLCNSTLLAVCGALLSLLTHRRLV